MSDLTPDAKRVNYEIFKLLLEADGSNFKEKIDVNAQDIVGHTALSWLIYENSNQEMLNLLLTINGDHFKEKLDVNIEYQSQPSYSLLQAVKHSPERALMLLQNNGTNFKDKLDVNVIYNNEYATTALHEAIDQCGEAIYDIQQHDKRYTGHGPASEQLADRSEELFFRERLEKKIEANVEIAKLLIKSDGSNFKAPFDLTS